MAFFLVGGAAHFVFTEAYVSIMPPWLPAHGELVRLSGAFELLGAAGLAFGRTRRAAGIGLMLLIIAVFPANLHMALHPERFADLPRWVLYARLPLQFVLLGWAWWATRPSCGRVPGTR